jgi:hypothetical protein
MSIENFHWLELMKRLDKTNQLLEQLVEVIKGFQREEVRAIERVTYTTGAINEDEVD